MFTEVHHKIISYKFIKIIKVLVPTPMIALRSAATWATRRDRRLRTDPFNFYCCHTQVMLVMFMQIIIGAVIERFCNVT